MRSNSLKHNKPHARVTASPLSLEERATRASRSMGNKRPTYLSQWVLAPLDLGDLVGLGAAGRDDFHGSALLLADQRARQRRSDGNAALLGVGFRLANDLPDRFLVGVLVDQCDGRAELDGVAGELADVDNVGARKLVLQLGDPAFIMGLLFLGGVILRILRKVAMRARLGDMLDDARTIHRLALLQFNLEGGITARGHRNLFHHLSSSFNIMRTNPRHAQTPKQNTLMTGEFQPCRLHCRSIAGRTAVRPKDQVSEK